MIVANHILIIVTPVYEDVEASSRLFKELAAAVRQDVFVVAVDDGSVKQPVEYRSLENAGIEGVVLKLRRNVGHQRAIAIGLGYVSEHMQPDSANGRDGFGWRRLAVDHSGAVAQRSLTRMLTWSSHSARAGWKLPNSRRFMQVYKRFFSLMTGRDNQFRQFHGAEASMR